MQNYFTTRRAFKDDGLIQTFDYIELQPLSKLRVSPQRKIELSLLFGPSFGVEVRGKIKTFNEGDSETENSFETGLRVFTLTEATLEDYEVQMNKYTCFILVFTFMLLPAKELRACSCVPPGPPSEAFEDADAVFLATVTSFKRADETSRVARLILLKLWKGEKALVSEIFTGVSSAACGFDFVVGETYLIYAYSSEDGKLRTSICTRTRHEDGAAEDLAFLEQLDSQNSGCCGGPLSSGDALLAGVVLMFILKKQKR